MSPSDVPADDQPLVVCAANEAIARELAQGLAEHGLDGQPATPDAIAERARSSTSPLVLIDGALLATLLHERAVAAARAGAPTVVAPEITDQAAFLERAAQVLAAAQPPNDQVALLLVHVEMPAIDDESRAAATGELVRRLRSCIRDRDALGHAGGLGRNDPAPTLAQVGEQEFTVLLPGLPRLHVAFKIAQRIQERVRHPIELASGTLTLDAAIGIALHPSDARDANALLEGARAARSAVQKDSGAGIRFRTPAMNTAALQRVTLEHALKNALERGELCVHYQPKIDIATGRIAGAEALARWKHPELGMVPPGQFVPIAEETGLINAIGEFVLAESCRQNRAWQDAGLPPVRVAVNLSPLQLRETQLLATLKRTLAETRLAADWLELEITESVLLQHAEATVLALNQIRQLGVHLSIDDFGTGYSSLAYLKRFPIDSLKIDQSFVRDLTTNPDDAAITTSIILMGKSLKLRVVAEGVETRSQLALLHVLECDEAQGYLFSKPVPPADFAKLLEKGIDQSLLPQKTR